MSKQRLELTWYNKDKALIPKENGKYGYEWVEPSDPRYCETHTLIYDEYIDGVQSPKKDNFEYSERADLEPQFDNLMIHGESGDVLEALTRVPELAEKYVGQVKLIYIDPPFNTEQTFDSYEDNLEHSIWLTMMRDRLLNLKKLLTEDGSIWIHLDDKEDHRMRLLLDEVFGEKNFIARMVWQSTYSPKNNGFGISVNTDYILVYGKTTRPFINRLPRNEAMNLAYKNPDKDPKGRWTNGDPAANHSSSRRQHPGVYGIQHPFTGEMMYPPTSANWRFSQDTVLELMREWGNYEFGEITESELERRRAIEGPNIELRNDVYPLIIPNWGQSDIEVAKKRYLKGAWPIYWFTGNGYGGMRRKTYLNEVADRIPENLLFFEEVGHTDSAKKELKALFPGIKPFDTPKPEKLLERILQISTLPGDIVLDCFAGSGTTAAVAQKMGRRWVTCELIEYNFETFIKPRLEMVVNDKDPGGITLTKDRTIKEKTILPEGLTADDLFKSTQLLNKLKKEEINEEQQEAIKVVSKMIATSPSKTLNWRGGGGFQVAHLSPSCFDYDPTLNRVILTEDATGHVLIESVAANLGFSLLTDDSTHIFDGKRGKSYLKVHEGIADTSLIDSLVGALHEDETLVLATTGVLDGVREYLRRVKKGSRIIHLPDGIFNYTKEVQND